MTDDHTMRFGGVDRLYGAGAVAKLASAHVTVIGLGGVGSWTVEALARSGVGALTLIDLDDVCLTNVNRQLPALTETVGMPKAEVLARRIHAIHPACRVRPVLTFLNATNGPELLNGGCDWVVDAVDRTSTKVWILQHCRQIGQRCVTIGGAGGRRDGTAVRCADIVHSRGDLLLRGVRKKLRRDHAFPREEGMPWGIPSVFSAEPQVFPWADGTCRPEPEAGTSLAMDCASGFGAITHVTAAFGLAAAGAVITALLA
jgi:tRNA threonylcarbamoyladenosine dehydratase